MCVYSATSHLSNLAAAAEMAITAAGLTSLELSSAGIPTAVVAIEPHQLDFMCCLVDQGLVFPLLKMTRSRAIDWKSFVLTIF